MDTPRAFMGAIHVRVPCPVCEAPIGCNELAVAWAPFASFVVRCDRCGAVMRQMHESLQPATQTAGPLPGDIVVCTQRSAGRFSGISTSGRPRSWTQY